MNHNEAVRMQAAEKYVLGELAEAQLLAYEEHYFECAQCALDVRAAAAFVDSSRQVFAEGGVAVPARGDGRVSPEKISWVDRFRALVAGPVPALAALVLVAILGYQNAVTIPHLKQDHSTLPGDGRSFDLGASGVRGGDLSAADTPHLIRRDGDFSVGFDFTPNARLAAYVCQLEDPSGRVLLQLAVPAERANQHYVLSVPGGLVPDSGRYRIVLRGADPRSGRAESSEVQQFVFTLAFQQ